jgi:hypothetical protein
MMLSQHPVVTNTNNSSNVMMHGSKIVNLAKLMLLNNQDKGVVKDVDRVAVEAAAVAREIATVMVVDRAVAKVAVKDVDTANKSISNFSNTRNIS